MQALSELVNPWNALLAVIVGYLVYKLVGGGRKKQRADSEQETFKWPPPLARQDLTLSELAAFDGKGADGRVCIAVLGQVFDVTKGRRFYGPGGPYSTLAGHDATRSLATFDTEAVSSEWDDCDDLTPSQRSAVGEWLEQFQERYELVGRLVKDAQDKQQYDEQLFDDHPGDDK